MMIGLAISPCNTALLAGGGWSPLSLGASLYDMWDAEQTSLLTLSGAAVTAWLSVKNSYSAAQTLSASKPIWASNSFNSRPGLTFDGFDDELTYAGVGIFPTGAVAGEIWALIDQTALVADTNPRIITSYGGNVSTSRRRLTREVVSGVNRVSVSAGIGSGEQTRTNTSIDFSGRHVVRGIITGSAIQTDVDGTAGASLAAVPATGTTRTRFGANTADTAAGFLQGVVSMIAFTAPLSSDEAGKMLNYLKTRGGIA